MNLECLRGIIPSKEEYFKRILEGEAKKSTEWTEIYAERIMCAIGAPTVHKVDGNPLYRNRGKNLFKPDFVLGANMISIGNDPLDFYVDVQEITGGPWDVKKRENPFFPDGSPVRKLHEKLRDTNVTEKNPIFLPINEYNSEISKAIFKPLHKKANKYGRRNRKSSRFGLISIQSPQNNFDAMIHLMKLKWLVFQSIIYNIQTHGASCKDVEVVKAIAIDAITGVHNGLIPVAAQMADDHWCFWAIVSTIPPGNCLFVVNLSGLERAESDRRDQVTQWISTIGMGQKFEYLNRLQKLGNL